MPVWYPRSEGQAVTFQSRQTGKPVVVTIGAGTADLFFGGAGDGYGLRADATHQRESRLLRQYVGGAGCMKPGMGDDGVRKSVSRIDGRNPARLADLIGAVPFRLAMHGGQHIVGGGVLQVVGRKIVAL